MTKNYHIEIGSISSGGQHGFLELRVPGFTQCEVSIAGLQLGVKRHLTVKIKP